MKNLFLPEVDLSLPPQFNHAVYNYWSIKNEYVSDYAYIEEAFTPDEIFEVLKICRSFPINESKTADGRSFSEVRKSYNSWIPPCELTTKIYEKIQDLVLKANKLFFNYDLNSIENLQYTEYESSYEGYYDYHVDKGVRPSSPDSHRKLSFSVQLTEESEYEGGELKIYTGKDPILAKKKIGTINFFPSYALHKVTPVTKGIRCCLVGWVSGPKFR